MSASSVSQAHQPGAAPVRRASPFLLVTVLSAVVVIWSVNYIIGKITLRHIDGLSAASFRMEISALLLLAIYFGRRERTPLRSGDVWTFAYLGFFGFAVNQGLFVIGLAHTTSEHSALIVGMGPVLILLLANALKLEKLTIAKAAGMGVCLLGIVLLETEHGSPARSPLLTGDLIALAGTLGFSIYTVLGRKVAGAYDTLSMNTFNAVVGGIIFLPLAVRQGFHLDWKNVGWVGWAGLLYMAVMSSVVGYLMFFWLLRHMEASRVAVVSYLQPVVVVLLSIPFLGEHPTRRLLVSGALVLIGVYMTERSPAHGRV